MTGAPTWVADPTRPWRATSRGILVGTTDEVVLLQGPAAGLWTAMVGSAATPMTGPPAGTGREGSVRGNPLAAVASLGLPGARARWPDQPLDDDRWVAFLSELVRHRLVGLAARAAAADALVITGAQLDQLAEAEELAERHCVRIEVALLRVADRFEQEGISFLVLKGPAFAHLAEADASARVFSDLDLLVPADQLDRAVIACERLGARRRRPELRPGWDRRFAKSVTMTGPEGFEYDLHRTLALGPHALLIRPEDLWDRPDSFVLGDRRVAALRPEAAFLHACLHATLDLADRLQTLRDLVLLADRADLDDAALLARRWKAGAAAREAVTRALSRLDVEHERLPAWAAGLAVGREEERLLRLHRPGARTNRRLGLAGVRYVPGLRQKSAYARALAFPSRANRAARRAGAAG